MGLSSNILWHQTNGKAFYEIIKTRKLRYSYSLERIIPEFHLVPFAFPMISMSDYPFSEICHNEWTYGDYCIGFKQSWGEKVGFSPVWYCSLGSRGLQQINKLLKGAIKLESKPLLDSVLYMFANMKFIQAPLETKKQSFKRYRFYDEREWRVVPSLTETENASTPAILTEDGYMEFKKNNNGISLIDLGVDFQYDDIHYIIVKSDTDIQETKNIVGDRIHIFTKEEVIEDIIGIEHHEVILPSQEQMDLEAANRHIERVAKLINDAWKKRMKEND